MDLSLGFLFYLFIYLSIYIYLFINIYLFISGLSGGIFHKLVYMDEILNTDRFLNTALLRNADSKKS